jgi:uncharacterized protein (DUF427 family)
MHIASKTNEPPSFSLTSKPFEDLSMNELPVESVWDYPRPPRLEPTASRIRILHASRLVADTTAALRILETSHPPVYYLPPAALDLALLRRSSTRQTFCEFKGLATYWSLAIPGHESQNVAWSYETPSQAFGALKGYLAFYATRVDECWVADERVIPQPGDFYGGWITANLRGPFKGAPGTLGW